MMLAVCLHIYYEKQVPMILQYLQNLKGIDYDLFVTSTGLSEETVNQLKSFNSETIFIDTPNRGYDIGPFIEFLHHIDFDKYEYVLKLHTKGTKSNNYTWLNGNRLDNKLWGKILWDSMLESGECVQRALATLEQNPKIGMLGSKYCLTSHPQDYAKFLGKVNLLLSEMNLPTQEKISFVAGAMFMVRARLLKPLLNLNITDFEPTDGKIKEGTLAHVVERVFGAIVISQEKEIKGIVHGNYPWQFFIASLKRFFFQSKITSSGKHIVKICKIPVYSKKLLLS